MLPPPFNCTGTLSKPSSQKLVFSLLFEGVSIESVFAFVSRRGARVPILHRKKKNRGKFLPRLWFIWFVVPLPQSGSQSPDCLKPFSWGFLC